MSNIVGKDILAHRLRDNTTLTLAEAEAAVDALAAIMAKALVDGEEVRIPGVGTFKTKERAAHEARNPATGATLTVEAHRVVAFKPSEALRDNVR